MIVICMYLPVWIICTHQIKINISKVHSKLCSVNNWLKFNEIWFERTAVIFFQHFYYKMGTAIFFLKFVLLSMLVIGHCVLKEFLKSTRDWFISKFIDYHSQSIMDSHKTTWHTIHLQPNTCSISPWVSMFSSSPSMSTYSES